MAECNLPSPVCSLALQERESDGIGIPTDTVLPLNVDQFREQLSRLDPSVSKTQRVQMCEESETQKNYDLVCNGIHDVCETLNKQSTDDDLHQVLPTDAANLKKLNGVLQTDNTPCDNGVSDHVQPSHGSDMSIMKPTPSTVQNRENPSIVTKAKESDSCLCLSDQNENKKDLDVVSNKLVDLSLAQPDENCGEDSCDRENTSLSKQTVDAHGIEYIVYESEKQMPDIMRLITKDLSEPYSIYTYRYFIHNWPKLCFLAKADDKCVGAIVCKLDLHKKMTRRGYIAMLAVDSEYRRRQIGSTLVTKAIDAMIRDDCDEVVLETEITNQGALHLYENLGFVRDKRLFRYYLNGVDALRLKLWLR